MLSEGPKFEQIPLWQPPTISEKNTSSKTDNARLFLYENEIKKAIREYVKENYNLDISEINFHTKSPNVFVDCSVEETE